MPFCFPGALWLLYGEAWVGVSTELGLSWVRERGAWGAWGKKEKRSGNNMKVKPVKLADLGDVRKLEASALTPSYSVA